MQVVQLEWHFGECIPLPKPSNSTQCPICYPTVAGNKDYFARSRFTLGSSSLKKNSHIPVGAEFTEM